MNRLKKIRLLNDLSQNDMARIIGKERTKISRIELNKGELTASEIINICKALNLSADYLLGLIDINTNKRY
ncbi:MAG: helix-turn-helix transcriptional regulator [Bacilli bacterium]|nr:helix-turn-helix transcriptional regulator [Bacilli bacterium]